MVGGVYSCIGLYRFLYSFCDIVIRSLVLTAFVFFFWRYQLFIGVNSFYHSTVVRHRDFVGAPAHADENSIESVSSLVYTVYNNCLMHVAIVAFIYQTRISFDR